MTDKHLDETQAKGLKRIWIDYTVEVDAPPAEVYALLADVDTWPRWSPGVRDIRRRPGIPMQPGTRFWLVLDIAPVPFPVSLPCELFVREPGRIEWGGGMPGSKIRHRFELSALPSGGTRLRHVEYATNLLALLALPAERFAHAHDRRWSDAIREHFKKG